MISIRRQVRECAVLIIVLAGTFSDVSAFSTLTEITDLTNPWLVIGTGAPNDGTTPEGVFNKGVGAAWQISNFEIGAIKTPVPDKEFSGNSIGPGLQWKSNVPFIPGVTFPAPNENEGIDAGPSSFNGVDFGGPLVGVLPQGDVITYDGQVAITHLEQGQPGVNSGNFDASNAGIFAKNVSDGGAVPDGLDAGVVCAGAAVGVNAGCIGTLSNTAFNDPDYPNSIGDPATNNPFNSAFELADGNGITGGQDFSALRTALDAALLGEQGGFVGIPDLATEVNPVSCLLEVNNSGTYTELCGGGNVINLSASGGQINGSNVTDPTNLYIKLNDGLNVLDFDLGAGNDLTQTNANIIIDGSEDARAIFRVPTGAKFNINQGNIVLGDMGIMNMNVMFFSETPGSDAGLQSVCDPDCHNPVFEFNDTIFNGVAFWALGDGTSINVNNSLGCVQYVSDKVHFDNVRYNQCSFKGEPPDEPGVPEPGTISLLAIGLVGLRYRWNRGRNKQSRARSGPIS